VNARVGRRDRSAAKSEAALEPLAWVELRRVLQTAEKRTVRRRLAQLGEQAESLGIGAWLQQTLAQLPPLGPAIGSRRLPRTINGIERFFRPLTRFSQSQGASIRSGVPRASGGWFCWSLASRNESRTGLPRLRRLSRKAGTGSGSAK